MPAKMLTSRDIKKFIKDNPFTREEFLNILKEIDNLFVYIEDISIQENLKWNFKFFLSNKLLLKILHKNIRFSQHELLYILNNFEIVDEQTKFSEKDNIELTHTFISSDKLFYKIIWCKNDLDYEIKQPIEVIRKETIHIEYVEKTRS